MLKLTKTFILLKKRHFKKFRCVYIERRTKKQNLLEKEFEINNSEKYDG